MHSTKPGCCLDWMAETATHRSALSRSKWLRSLPRGLVGLENLPTHCFRCFRVDIAQDVVSLAFLEIGKEVGIGCCHCDPGAILLIETAEIERDVAATADEPEEDRQEAA